MIFWGIDTEASNKGKTHEKSDLHSIQVCNNLSEKKSGKVFTTPRDFKRWYMHDVKPRPKIFYAFTLPFEYGTLSAWELLHTSAPWQFWSDKPVNLFYINLKKTKRSRKGCKIPIFDVRILFHQLRYGNLYLSSLKKLGDYLSDYYKEDIHKLAAPMGEDFGKRAPSLMVEGEFQYFEKYGIRDAFIAAKAAEWLHTNIIEKWLHGKIDITRLYSWGTVARHYFNLPTINESNWYARERTVTFPNIWHKKIFEQTYAGRNEAFKTGNVGEQYYNDVGSLYPISMIETQWLLIKDVEDVTLRVNKDVLLGKASWQKFYESTGVAYGWVLGDFRVNDDLWSLPYKVGENNWYVKGEFLNGLYHILDLQASNAEILKVHRVLNPVFDKSQAKLMKRFEQLTKIKLYDEYESQIEKYCIKSTINSTSGILGKSHPNFAEYTNIPAYNTLLAQSHLFMSELFHTYHSKRHPIVYTDTDSFFWDQPVGTQDKDKLIKDCKPYPDLPFQVLDTVPLTVGLRGVSRPEGTVIFRAKMYYQGESSFAFSGWKPRPEFFEDF